VIEDAAAAHAMAAPSAMLAATLAEMPAAEAEGTARVTPIAVVVLMSMKHERLR